MTLFALQAVESPEEQVASVTGAYDVRPLAAESLEHIISEMRLDWYSRSAFLSGALKKSKTSRKKPSQIRSKELVDTLVEAAARVFTTLGFEAATTNAIAEAAGVSIGSLYQYFPNKLGLLAAVNERHIIGLWTEAGRACREACSLSWPEALRHFVATSVQYNVKSGRLFGILQKELPANTPFGPQLNATRLSYEADLRTFLTAHKSEIAIDLDRAVYMIPIIGKGVVTTAFLSRPADLRNGRLIDEVVSVLQNYLTQTSPSGPVDRAVIVNADS